MTLGHIPGQATLEIAVKRGDYTPGVYQVTMLSEIGEPGHEYSQIFYISDEIL
ncbi:hypothetical protein HQ563_12225 [bacterium]|nr:hypothetical protein [bacterium]